MITAILKAGILQGKMRIKEPMENIDILIPMPLLGFYDDLVAKKLRTTPRFRFIWKRQVKKYTHEYVLAEVG